MNLKNAVKLATASAAMALACSPASAGFQVLDAWQLQTPVGLTTNIGRLNLVSGSANVQQEVNAGGNIFVGANFVESGNIFSVTYTANTVVGISDIGPPQFFAGNELFTFTFTDVKGVITSILGDGSAQYSFTSGNFLMEGAGGVDYLSGSVVGLGGTLASTNIVGGTNGDSTLLAAVTSILAAGFDMKDSGGNSLAPSLLDGSVLFEAVTNNSIDPDDVTVGACSFAVVAGNSCLNFVANSAGDAYLVRSVPTPGTLALAGLSLIGLAAVSRRAAKNSK